MNFPCNVGGRSRRWSAWGSNIANASFASRSPGASAAAPNKSREPETPGTDGLGVRELKELVPHESQVCAMFERFVILALEPLIAIDQLHLEALRGGSETAERSPKHGLSRRGSNAPAHSASPDFYRHGPPMPGWAGSSQVDGGSLRNIPFGLADFEQGDGRRLHRRIRAQRGSPGIAVYHLWRSRCVAKLSHYAQPVDRRLFDDPFSACVGKGQRGTRLQLQEWRREPDRRASAAMPPDWRTARPTPARSR